MTQLKDLRSARELVAFIEEQDWSAIDADTRAIALRAINQAITKLREHAGLVPIVDALPGQPLRAFQLIRNIINQFPAPSGETKPGGVVRAK